jgi:glycosyltransferase involved in cell wall biosynthesis
MVSIVMPVYNTAPYLRQAIDSILQQTFADFEFIIINDGSTDESGEIASEYTDHRIKYSKNEKNSGLVYTLNKGIEQAKGHYIARMDGDDIALPHRLEKQYNYLRLHEGVDLLASVVQLINEKGNSIGFWEDDKNNISPGEIRRFMAVNNCIAHPSIMAKADMFKQYRYDSDQYQAEDYDLWLRMLADGKKFHKLPDALLLHRVLPRSFTRSQQKNIFYKLATTKFRFFVRQLGKGRLNGFTLRTALFSITDSIRGFFKATKLLFKK